MMASNDKTSGDIVSDSPPLGSLRDAGAWKWTAARRVPYATQPLAPPRPACGYYPYLHGY